MRQPRILVVDAAGATGLPYARLVARLQPMYELLQLQSTGLAFDAFVAIQVAHVKQCFSELVQSNLAEPYALDS